MGYQRLAGQMQAQPSSSASPDSSRSLSIQQRKNEKHQPNQFGDKQRQRRHGSSCSLVRAQSLFQRLNRGGVRCDMGIESDSSKTKALIEWVSVVRVFEAEGGVI
jgi:hypothetical protein